jgi:hypothetical protein
VVGRDHRSEMVHPTPNRLIGHGHSAFRQQIFDVAQAEGEPEVEPYRLVNDLRRETIPILADFLHRGFAVNEAALGHDVLTQKRKPPSCDGGLESWEETPKEGICDRSYRTRQR